MVRGKKIIYNIVVVSVVRVFLIFFSERIALEDKLCLLGKKIITIVAKKKKDINFFISIMTNATSHCT